MPKLTEHFNSEEFDCKCGCGKNNISKELVDRLEQVRRNCGYPIVITSGCRCEKHNLAVGGKENSSHLLGLAADIQCDFPAKRRWILRHSIYVFDRIGIAKYFIHLDIDPNKPVDVIWLY